MIRVTTEKNQEEKNLEDIDKGILEIARQAHILAITLKRVNERFWKLPDDQLIEVMNSVGPAKISEIFGQNTKLGTAVNESLDSVEEASLLVRAPVVQGRSDVVFNATSGKFEIVPQEEEGE